MINSEEISPWDDHEVANGFLVIADHHNSKTMLSQQTEPII